jgi:hypothetical protein
LKVIANEKLSYKFKDIGFRVNSVSDIVRNDAEITEQQLKEFHALMVGILNDLRQLETSVHLYVKSCVSQGDSK